MNCQSLTDESVSFRRKCTSGGKAVVLAPDESWIGVSGTFEGVNRYRMSDGSSLLPHLGSQSCSAMKCFDSTVITGEQDGTIRIYDTTASTRHKVLRVHADAVYGIQLTSDGRIGISLDEASCISLWDRRSNTVVGRLTEPTAVTDLKKLRPVFGMSHDNRWLVTLTDRSPIATSTASVRVYDLRRGEARQSVDQQID